MKSSSLGKKPFLCAYSCCPSRSSQGLLDGSFGPSFRSRIVIRGFFLRKHSRKRIRRFHCRDCQRSFSEATFEPEFHQRKRDLNGEIRKLLCSSVSQRRTALLLGVARKTVARKFRFLAKQATLELDQDLKQLSELPESVRPKALHFDEMEVQTVLQHHERRNRRVS